MNIKFDPNVHTDSKILDREIRIALKRTKGMTVIPAPTGSGKTYNLTKNIARIILAKNELIKEEYPFNRFVVVIPNLNNFPTQEEIAKKICKMISCDEPTAMNIIKQNVLYMYSNLDCMKMGINEQYEWVKEYFPKITGISRGRRQKILDAIEGIKEYITFCYSERNNQNNASRGRLQELNEKTARNDEETIRKEFRSILKTIDDNIQTAKKANTKNEWSRREKAVKSIVRKIFAPANCKDRCVWIMTTDKFINVIDPVIDPSFLMLDEKMLKDTTIFMDESDSSYERMRDSIISNVIGSKIPVKELMVELTSTYFTRTLTHEVEQTMKKAFKNPKNPCRLENLRKEGDAFKEAYKLSYAYKTDNNTLNGGIMPALLNDGKQYNLGDKTKFIQANLHKPRKQVLFSLKKKGSRKTPTPGDINIMKFFSESKTLIYRFANFLKFTGMAYKVNWEKKHSMIGNNGKVVKKEKELSEAITTIMSSMDMINTKTQSLFLNLCLQKSSATKPNRFLNDDFSFFSRGYDLKIIKDNEERQAENSIIEMYWSWTTPEKILLTMASTANVILSSATALNRSINENFAMSYIKDQLGKEYHEMTEEGKNSLCEFYMQKNQPYYDGRWKINTVVLPTMSGESLLPENENEFLDKISTPARAAFKTFTNQQYFYKIVDILRVNKIKGYDLDRYFNVVHVLSGFIHDSMLKSILCLEKKALCDDLSYNRKMINSFKDFICMDAGIDPKSISIFSALSSNFTETMNTVKTLWSHGEKAILFSTYATMSKGANLQYRVPEDQSIQNNLIKLKTELETASHRKVGGKDEVWEKDIDCLYLGNYTYAIATIDSAETNEDTKAKQFHRVIVESEKLCALNQIYSREKRLRIINAYINYAGITSNSSEFDKIIRATDGIKNAINKTVKQSVGRTERTYTRNKKTQIYIAEELITGMDIKELKDTEKDLIPAMLEIKKLADAYYTPEEKQTEAEKKQDSILIYAAQQHRRSVQSFKRLLRSMRQGNKELQKEAISRYNILREIILSHPILTKKVYDTLPETTQRLIQQFYVDTGRNDVISYAFEQEDEEYTGIRDLDDLWIKVKGFNLTPSDTIREGNTILPTIMKMKEIAEFFTNSGYATTWGKGRYILTPKGRDIYNGILGEVVVEHILHTFLKSLKHMHPDMANAKIEAMAPEVVEKFDFRFGRMYIDVKNWRMGVARLNANEFKEHILKKRAECDEFYGKPGAAVIINLLPENDAVSNEQLIQEDNYIEIRRLLNPDLTINEIAQKKIMDMMRKAVESNED